MILLHTFLNLMKQEVATKSQWKNYDKIIGKLWFNVKKTILSNYFLWSYISAEWQETCELESTFNEIIKKVKESVIILLDL